MRCRSEVEARYRGVSAVFGSLAPPRPEKSIRKKNHGPASKWGVRFVQWSPRWRSVPYSIVLNMLLGKCSHWPNRYTLRALGFRAYAERTRGIRFCFLAFIVARASGRRYRSDAAALERRNLHVRRPALLGAQHPRLARPTDQRSADLDGRQLRRCAAPRRTARRRLDAHDRSRRRGEDRGVRHR